MSGLVTVSVVEPVTRRRLIRNAGMATFVGLAGCTTASATRPTLVQASTTTTSLPEFGQVLRSPEDVDEEAIDPGREVVDVNDDSDDSDDSELAHRSIIATAAVSQIQVFAEADTAAEVTHEMDNPTATNGPLVFLTTENTADWHRVLLPVRPNGSTGWVRSEDVQLASHFYRIEVDLADFRLRVFEHGQSIFDAVAGVASNNTPTPGGVYYLTELLAPTVPNSAYGAFAYGLSGFSEVFETFNGGPGQLGIHGTNDPDTLGTAVSAGCIRLHNDDVSRLATYLPLGVPVTVRA